MSGAVIGFIIWTIVGIIIICIGVGAFISKKAVGFWANIKPIVVKDIKGYNYATGKLLVAYGLIFIGLGFPLLSGQNSPLIMLSALGVMVETIVIMAVYCLYVEKKYKE